MLFFAALACSMLNFSIMQTICCPQKALQSQPSLDWPGYWHLTMLHGFACLSPFFAKRHCCRLGCVAQSNPCFQWWLPVCHRGFGRGLQDWVSWLEMMN